MKRNSELIVELFRPLPDAYWHNDRLPVCYTTGKIRDPIFPIRKKKQFDECEKSKNGLKCEKSLKEQLELACKNILIFRPDKNRKNRILSWRLAKQV